MFVKFKALNILVFVAFFSLGIKAETLGDVAEKLFSLSEWQQLRYVNDRINGRAKSVRDNEAWGEEDYWATPLELWTVKKADCEDFAITKFLLLEQAGLPSDKMLLSHVRLDSIDEPHMVLLVFSAQDEVYYVLDNINPKVLPLSRRRDVQFVYSFNRVGVWVAKGANPKGTEAGRPSQIGKWGALLNKWAQQEQQVFGPVAN